MSIITKPATATINGVDYDATLARIERVTLGTEDHGMFVCYLHFEWKGGGQGFGGYVLHGARGMEYIRRLTEVVGDLTQCTGKLCLILREQGRDYDMILGVAALTLDKSFVPKVDLAEFQ